MIIKKIVLCETCKGSGKIERQKIEDYHHNDYYIWDEVCGSCDGFGRVLRIIEISTLKLTLKDLSLIPKPEGAENE
jgi:hypothetical protein